MKTSQTETRNRLVLKEILYLTDFSEPSAAALPFATATAREYGATLHALHVLRPEPYTCTTPELTVAAVEAQEDNALAEMQLVESQLTGLAHKVSVVRGFSVWPSVLHEIEHSGVGLIVLGTHGRTGAQKLLMGSAAEEIFRQSPIPVLTIGPSVRNGAHNGGRFHRVLFATDFSPESLAAAPYAISLAQENQARLILLHVIRKPLRPGDAPIETSVANALYALHELVPAEAELWCRAEAYVEYGEPAEQILEAAKKRDADLIVLGVRDAAGRLGAATHLAKAVAHRVVAHANCAVLTVRGPHST